MHYVSYGTPGGEYSSVCQAATITQVATADLSKPVLLGADGLVGLAVLNPTGLFFHESVRHDEQHAAGTWHWPERVD